MLFSGDTNINSIFFKTLPNWSERMVYLGFDNKRKCHYFVEINEGISQLFIRKLDEDWNLLEEFDFATKYPNIAASRIDRGGNFYKDFYDGIRDYFWLTFNTPPDIVGPIANGKYPCKIHIEDNLSDWTIGPSFNPTTVGSGEVWTHLQYTDDYLVFATSWYNTLKLHHLDINTNTMVQTDLSAIVPFRIFGKQNYKRGNIFYFSGTTNAASTNYIVAWNVVDNTYELIEIPYLNATGVKLVTDNLAVLINTQDLIYYDYLNEVEIKRTENWGNGLWNGNSFFEDSKIKSIGSNNVRLSLEQQSTSNKPLFSGDVTDVGGLMKQTTRDKPLANL